jgi:hypothetical protein
MVLTCHGQMDSAAMVQREVRRRVVYKPIPKAPSSHLQAIAQALKRVPGIRKGTGVIMSEVQIRK